MTTLMPAPATLGLASPALGPWFHHNTEPIPTLGEPAPNLSVAVPLNPGVEWRAPAGGVVSYAYATNPRPVVLASLRQANGTPAFATGNLAVVFRLLPEVELRLAALSNVIPSPDGQEPTPPEPGRPPVRYLALEVPGREAERIAEVQRLREQDFDTALTTDDDRAKYLGLAIGAGGLTNGVVPVRELHRPAHVSIVPGTTMAGSAVITKNRTGAPLDVSLWAFDNRGRALDPGAVACWWAHLAAAVFDNLWASPDLAQRTAAVEAGRYVLMCSPHEGPLPESHRDRLELDGLDAVTPAIAESTLYRVGNGPAVRLGATPDPDTMPIPRVALLPNSDYAPLDGTGTSLFAGWTGAAWPTTLPRDFARVAIGDLEQHLVGVDRSDDGQNDPRLRINALRNTAADPFLTTTDAVAAQISATIANATAARVMAPVVDNDWGPLDPPALDPGEPHAALTYSVHALRGAGTAADGTVSDQRVVIRCTDLPDGAWIRIWTEGLDVASGRRFRQDGGGGRADGGRAFVVVALPDGTAAPTPLDRPIRMGFDAVVVTDSATRFYIEQRFNRPALIAGAPEPLPALPGNLPSGLTAWICEQGTVMGRGVGQLGSGETLLAVPDDETNGVYALVDPATLANTDLAASTLRNAVAAGDQVIVTVPAFADTPDGQVADGTGPVGAAGARIVRRTRNALTEVPGFGRPLPTMERREVAAVDAAGAAGAIGATPGRAASHEEPPAQLGHPTMPAAPEIHGTGAALAGPLVVELEKLMRERAAATLLEFVDISQRPLPTVDDPGGTTAYGAVLETLSRGVAGDAVVRAYLAADEHQSGQAWIDLKNEIEARTNNQVDLDSVIDTATFDDDALAAALDRVIVKTEQGATQVATALHAAIARAEDLIYLETPAIDAAADDDTDDGTIDLVGAIRTRLAERPGLVIVLCVPERFLPGTPRKLDTIRRAGVAGALKQLTDAAPGTVVLISPTAGPGRPLYLASTTVIVDDAILVTGTTHLWRRGLTFDTSLAIALFDENVTEGRPSAIRAARHQLLADRLAITSDLVPDDPHQLCDVLGRLNRAGGLLRVAPDAYPPTASVSATDHEIWNPDGRPGGTLDWFAFLNGLALPHHTEVNNAIR